MYRKTLLHVCVKIKRQEGLRIPRKIKPLYTHYTLYIHRIKMRHVFLIWAKLCQLVNFVYGYLDRRSEFYTVNSSR